MIDVVVEAITASITTISLGAMWLTGRIVKLKYDEDHRLDAEEAAEKERLREEEEALRQDGDVVLMPYAAVADGVQCPMCGIPCQINAEGEVLRGWGINKCSKKCRVTAPHVHASCTICNPKGWLMAPKQVADTAETR